LKASTLLDEIVAQSGNVESAAFSSLIKKCIALLRKEQKDQKSNQDRGRLLRLDPLGEAIVVGDIHGDLTSLTYVLNDSGFLSKARQDRNVHLVFLGDYGDRGPHSPEVFYVVLKLKVLFPGKVVLMRGNHEGPNDMIPCPYDLSRQFYRKYGADAGEKLLAELHKLFDRLYTSVIIDNRAILVHGGVPCNSKSIDDLAWAQKNHPKSRDLEEFLWNDPEDYIEGTTISPRGAGRLFGSKVTDRLIGLFGVKVIIRGHECCEEGFKFSHNGRVLTLFSTNTYPYCNQFGAYLDINLARKITSWRQLQKGIRQFPGN
jgi:hypothetical protein